MHMTGHRGLQVGAMLAFSLFAAPSARAQNVRYEDVNGIRYKVTQQEVSVPETTLQPQQKTVYRQQLTTNSYQSQSLVTVPTTQYRLVSRLRGRWNPFVTPYWTHHYQPVTTWSQQIATVEVPVSRLAWVPETRTVQAPVTTYRPGTNETRVAIGTAPSNSAANQQYASNTSPSATVAALPRSSAAPSGNFGGSRLDSDPPRQASTVQGWQPLGDRDRRYSR
jgi:hypothetical protein